LGSLVFDPVQTGKTLGSLTFFVDLLERGFSEDLLRQNLSLLERLHGCNISEDGHNYVVCELHDFLAAIFFFLFLLSAPLEDSRFALDHFLALLFAVQFLVGDDDAIIHLLEHAFELVVLALALLVHDEHLGVGQVMRIVGERANDCQRGLFRDQHAWRLDLQLYA